MDWQPIIAAVALLITAITPVLVLYLTARVKLIEQRQVVNGAAIAHTSRRADEASDKLDAIANGNGNGNGHSDQSKAP